MSEYSLVLKNNIAKTICMSEISRHVTFTNSTKISFFWCMLPALSGYWVMTSINHNIIIFVCYQCFLVNAIRERTESNRRLITVKFYITKEEFIEYEKDAFLMHREKVIPRPTVGAFAKAAGYKWFNEINKQLTKDRGNEQKRKDSSKDISGRE